MQSAKQIQPVIIDPAQALAELKWLALAVSTDETCVNLARVHVDGKRAVATDGYRLHFIEGTCLPAGFSIRGSDLETVLDLAKRFSLQAVHFLKDSTHWTFESTNGTCVLNLNLGAYTFPDYERVMPTEENPVDQPATDLRKVFVGENGKPDFCSIATRQNAFARFNARYIKEALNGAPKRVTVYLPADLDSPVLFRYLNRGAVVMPVRQ